MSSSSAVPCREVFDENSVPSAEEISEYAQQIGIDPEGESHLLPLAREGLMQALPPPWKAYYDEKIQNHYYYNEETNRTQWEHPLDNVYRELVRKARDASVVDDTYVSVQELLTSEENTKQLERVETKIESDEDLSTDSDENNSEIKDNASATLLPAPRRLTPLGRPPLAPLSKTLDKKLGDLRISPLRRVVDGSIPFKPGASRINQDKDVGRVSERPKLFKQQSEIIDLRMHVLDSRDEENFNLFLSGKGERVLKALPLTGKGSMFLKSKKADLPSPDTERSFPLDSFTKSDPPKGILREKIADSLQRRVESLSLGKPRHTTSLDEDRKSVRFKLEHTMVEPLETNISPGSNSSSERNDNQSSIISAPTHPPSFSTPLGPSNISAPTHPPSFSTPLGPSNISAPTHPPSFSTPLGPSNLSAPTHPPSFSTPLGPSNISAPTHPRSLSTPLGPSNISAPTHPPSSYSTPLVPSNMSTVPTNIVLSPIIARPPLPPRPQNSMEQILSPRDGSKSISGSEKESLEGEGRDRQSPRRRVVRPPAGDYIKPDLFQKNFHKIADLVRPGDIDSSPVHLTEPAADKEARPRSPMIPLMNKISINLMESIESETSIDSPDKEFANLDLNDMDISKNDENIPDPKENIILSPKQTQKEEKHTHSSSKPQKIIDTPQIKVPKLEFLSKSQMKALNSESEESIQNSLREDSKNTTRSESIEIQKMESKVLSPTVKLSPNPSIASEIRSPKSDISDRPWNNSLSTFKAGLNKAVISPQIKVSDSNTSINKGLASPRLDGVIISQGKIVNRSSDNVVVMYQFERPQDDNSYSKSMKSSSEISREVVERNKVDEKRRKELSLAKELEEMRAEWAVKEKKMRAELQEELQLNEERFKEEMKRRLLEQEERHRRELEEALEEGDRSHEASIQKSQLEREERFRMEIAAAEREFRDSLGKLRDEHARKLAEERRELELENERVLCDLRTQLQAQLHIERTRIIDENRVTMDQLREEQTARVTDLRHDYRVEVERLRTQHACHLEELRARLSSERAAAMRRGNTDHALADKYKCLKEKYARLKHDVKMSIERRNKRREMSMTTGSETEKSNSHKATQSLERCKELNETSVSAVIESEPARVRINNNLVIKYNDNETSLSESNAQKSFDNNNEEWRKKDRGDNNFQKVLSPETSHRDGKAAPSRARRTKVEFREPPRRRRDKHKDRDAAASTDFQDSSDATTADEKPKETTNNGHARRRCFTRLKSASTSRLNYSPKRGEGWSSPLEALRQQLRKLDDLEDQFPDLACQPPYSLRYPFGELGPVTTADSPELEFVRHRALVEREGMRRARAALRRRRVQLRETRSVEHAPSEERESTELEVALHRARALLGEKEIRLRHIERALRHLADARPAALAAPVTVQEGMTSDGSSVSSEGGEGGAAAAEGGAVLRSLRALHADVRDIWRALDARRPVTVSPETSTYNAASTSQPRMTLSAQDPVSRPDNSDVGVAERARGLRAWLQTTP